MIQPFWFNFFYLNQFGFIVQVEIGPNNRLPTISHRNFAIGILILIADWGLICQEWD